VARGDSDVGVQGENRVNSGRLRLRPFGQKGERERTRTMETSVIGQREGFGDFIERSVPKKLAIPVNRLFA
jgi:hypothetical protein